MRRRFILGGALLLAGAHRHRQLKKQDAERIEEHPSVSIDESDEAISELGIEEEPLNENDEVAVASAGE